MARTCRFPLDIALGALTAAQKVVDASKVTLDIANAALSTAQRVVDSSKGLLDVANAALSLAAAAVDKAKISLDAANLVLEGAKKVLDQKDLLKKIAIGALEAAKIVVDKSRVTLDIANGVLEGAKGVVTATKFTVKAGLEAGAAIAKFGLGGMVDVRKASFDVELSVANGRYFECSVTVQFMDQAEQTFNLSVNFDDMWANAKALANKAFDGISKLLN